MTRLRHCRSFPFGGCPRPFGVVARTLFGFAVEPRLIGHLAPAFHLRRRPGAFGSLPSAAFRLPGVPLGFEWQTQKSSGRYLGIRLQHLPQGL